jgi:hypothetical protein
MSLLANGEVVPRRQSEIAVPTLTTEAMLVDGVPVAATQQELRGGVDPELAALSTALMEGRLPRVWDYVRPFPAASTGLGVNVLRLASGLLVPRPDHIVDIEWNQGAQGLCVTYEPWGEVRTAVEGPRSGYGAVRYPFSRGRGGGGIADAVRQGPPG